MIIISQNILSQKENKTKNENFLDELKIVEKVTDKKALWNKARFLALMRSKRGTRNWAKAKHRVTKCLHEIASGRPKNDTQDAELINPLRRFSQQLFYRVKRQNNNNN